MRVFLVGNVLLWLVSSVGIIAIVVIVCFAFCGGGVRGNVRVTRGVV